MSDHTDPVDRALQALESCLAFFPQGSSESLGFGQGLLHRIRARCNLVKNRLLVRKPPEQRLNNHAFQFPGRQAKTLGGMVPGSSHQRFRNIVAILPVPLPTM